MRQTSKLFYALMIAVLLAAGCGGGSSDTAPQGAAASSAKAITAFSFTNPAAVGVISETTHAIAVTVPAGTNVTALVATFSTTGRTVTVGTTIQTSGVTSNNFTNPVVYTVTAADGTSQDYTVSVTVASAASLKAFLTFELAGVSGTINEATKTITVVLPPDGTDVTTLVATYTVSAGATVRVGATAQSSGITPNDFTHSVVYTVVASDSSTADYTAAVTILTAPKLMTSFSVTSSTNVVIPATIDQTLKTVTASIPLSTNRNALIATYATTTGAIVKIGTVVQTSGVTVNNFSTTREYTVVAPDVQEVAYRVSILYDDPRFTSFGFTSVSASGAIDDTTNSIAVTVPASTNIANLISAFTTTSTTLVEVAAAPQTSDVTANDFTTTVTYVLTGNTTTNYNVTVTKAPGVLSLPRTGQITSFSTSTTSDDGALQRGVIWPIPRFAAAGGMVTDNLTGLVWQQNANTPTVGACTGGVMDWQGGLDYIDCLNTNSYLGETDWRMPNANELASLLTASISNVYSWLNAQGFSNMQPNIYFSSTTDPAITTQARVVNMVTGNVIVSAKTGTSGTLNVLAVRGTPTGRAPVPQTGQTLCYDATGGTVACAGTLQDGDWLAGTAWPGTRFTPLGAGTTTMVQDNLTGLIWTANGNTPNSATCPMDGTWQGALNYIACLNSASYLSYSDWRLPNINELESLINAGVTDTSSWLNTQGFTDVQGNAYWTSTTDASTTSNAWLVFMVGGDKNSNEKTDSRGGTIKAWPVRSGY